MPLFPHGSLTRRREPTLDWEADVSDASPLRRDPSVSLPDFLLNLNSNTSRFANRIIKDLHLTSFVTGSGTTHRFNYIKMSGYKVRRNIQPDAVIDIVNCFLEHHELPAVACLETKNLRKHMRIRIQQISFYTQRNSRIRRRVDPTDLGTITVDHNDTTLFDSSRLSC